jgi:glycosyltransferase involved in cell wall biosynthesis
MKIGYDATSISRKITGIEGYSLGLLKSLISYDRVNDYAVFLPKGYDSGIFEPNTRFKFIECPVKNRFFCEQSWLPYSASLMGLDLMHFPAFPPGLAFKQKFVWTLHDAAMWLYPETLSWKNKAYMRPLSGRAVKLARRIITVSESSRQGIRNFFKLDDDRVINAGEALSGKFRVMDMNDCLGIRKKYGLDRDFVLFVGSIEPRKNLSLLLKALRLIKDRRNDPGFELIIAGRYAWGNNDLIQSLRRMHLSADVRLLGYVPDGELAQIFNLAKIFVFPSLYEGFGLPPLEAMACGTPVIASNTSSLPEVLDRAALYVSPFDPEGLADKIIFLLNDPEMRRNLTAEGLKRCRQFRWETVAGKIVSIYESA